MGTERIDRTVEGVLAALGLGTVAAQARLARAWADVVGPLLAAKTCPARLKGGVLTVSAITPAWAQEISLARNAVIERIDAAVGAGAVREIRVVVGPVPDEQDPAARGEEAGAAGARPADPGARPDPEGIDRVADPETRGILASLARRAASRRR